jgi:hypothetical protein
MGMSVPITHIDGLWNTTEFDYRGYKILIKSQKGKGMKAHAFLPDNPNKVDFTLRYTFIKPDVLLAKVKSKIDKRMLDGC